MLLAIESSVEDLNTTSVCDLLADVNTAPDADAKELALQTLVPKLVDSVTATIVMAQKPRGSYYNFKISASKGGVVVDADGIRFAAFFLGSSLPKRVKFDQIFKVGSRTFLELPSREEGFVKLMVWPRGGANYVASHNPGKVCAIARSQTVRSRRSRNCVCKPLIQRCWKTSNRS